MRYRAYRRKRQKIKNKQLERLADISSYPSAGLKIKILNTGKRTCLFDGEPDYVKRQYRGHRSKVLKKIYAKRLRNGKHKLNIYKGSLYKKASGDFWWDFC